MPDTPLIADAPTPDPSYAYMSRILLVDDDPTVLASMAEHLRRAGYEPKTFLHPSSVASLAPGERFGLAIIDVNLPGMSGIDLAARLKREAVIDEFAFISGHGTFDNLVAAIKLNANDYLKKPFTREELKLLLARYEERCELKRRVRQSEERHRALLENLPLLVYTLSANGSLSYVNPALTRLLGYAPEEVLERPGWFFAQIHPDDREDFREHVETALDTGQPFSMEMRLTHKKGHVVHGIAQSLPTVQEVGGGPGRGEAEPPASELMSVFVDITDRVVLERALVQDEKLKTLGSISAEVAHEIRNPLMSIAGFARRLQRKFPDTPEAGIILRESLRLEKLLQRIRDYLKPVRISREEVHVNTLVADVLHLLFPEMDKRKVWCEVDLDPTVETLKADPDLLSQVVINLIRNALKAVVPGSAFNLRTFTSQSTLHIEIKNRVAEDVELDPERLFLPFEEGGSSIGLPLSYRLVKNMGGLLAVSNEEGYALFTVSFPMNGAAGETSEALQAPPPSLTEPGSPAETVADEAGRSKACFDNQTGVLIRRRFDDLLVRMLRQSGRDGRPLSLLLIDLDHFLAYAESHGDEAARETIAHVAEVLRGVVTDACHLLARYGSQEFTALLPNTDAEGAKRLAERIRARVEELLVLRTVGREEMTVSIGVATCRAAGADESEISAQDVLAAAGKALYLAKESGRNAVKHLDARTEAGAEVGAPSGQDAAPAE